MLIKSKKDLGRKVAGLKLDIMWLKNLQRLGTELMSGELNHFKDALMTDMPRSKITIVVCGIEAGS